MLQRLLIKPEHIKMERIKLSVLALLILSALSSCRKQAASDSATVNVFVKSILVDGHSYFAASHMVSGTDAMRSVAVHTPDGVTDSLTSTDSSHLFYSLLPTFDVGGYTPDLPASGTYTYDIKFNDGIEKTFTDTLTSSYLLPASNLSAVESADGSSVNVTYNPVASVQKYQLLVTIGGIAVFSSTYISPSLNTNIILPTSYLSQYMPGTFTFEIDAILFRSSGYNLVQAVSAATTTVSLQ
jgi:hypothetical protein